MVMKLALERLKFNPLHLSKSALGLATLTLSHGKASLTQEEGVPATSVHPVMRVPILSQMKNSTMSDTHTKGRKMKPNSTQWDRAVLKTIAIGDRLAVEKDPKKRELLRNRGVLSIVKTVTPTPLSSPRPAPSARLRQGRRLRPLTVLKRSRCLVDHLRRSGRLSFKKSGPLGRDANERW